MKYNGDKSGNLTLIKGCNKRDKNAAEYDYYATDPSAVEKLLSVETFNDNKWIWEPACGEGHISKVFEAHGFDVISTDLIYRGYGEKESLNFLENVEEGLCEDIVTNLPYSYAQEFIEKGLQSICSGYKVIMLLKLTFLSSQGRREFFKKYPPYKIHVFSERIECGKNGIFLNKKGVDYAWFVWLKGHVGPTTIDWI